MQLLLADSLIFLSIPTAGLDIFFFLVPHLPQVL